MPDMTSRFPSLKWIETFGAFARCGSIQETAEALGISDSTASHHLHCLQGHVGVDLINHKGRPMTLTAAGTAYLRHVEDVLRLLEVGQKEARADSPAQLRQLRLGMIEDFEGDVGPEVTRLLASALPECQFTHMTRASRDILELLQNRELDIGVAMQPAAPVPRVDEYALLRDPFVIAIPTGSAFSGEDLITGAAALPLLRYGRNQIMGALIEAQLSRLRISLKNTFELDSTSSIMALVAQGNGWAITTPSNYARSKRFQDQVRLLPFPRRGFARTISVFVATPEANVVVPSLLTSLRDLLRLHTIAPLVERYSWLEDGFRLIPE